MRFVLQISAGNGPVEVRQFVALLAAHLETILRARGVAIISRVAGARSVALTCEGAGADDLVGTHALVHAARGRRARKRWFAGVTCHRISDAPSFRASEVVLSAARASGPGGQRVNKVSSAVRAVHSPTGISVRATGQRSQSANRREAIARLANKLDEREATARAQGSAQKRLAHYRVVRGGARFSYRISDGELVIDA